MAKTDPLDPSVPAGGEDPKLGDNRIRELARAVAELLNIDHYMGADGGAGAGYNEDAAGEHKRVTFKAPLTSDPANAPNKAFLYTKDVAEKVELFWRDENGVVRQLTSGGKLHSDGGFSMLSGQVATIETIQAVDATGVVIKNKDGDTVITAKDDGKAQLADGSKLASGAAPDGDTELVNQKYVDDQIAAIKDPTYEGGESHTFDGGLIIKQGVKTLTGATTTVTFATPFPHDCVRPMTCPGASSGDPSNNINAHTPTAANFKIYLYYGGGEKVNWIAIGY